MTLPGMALVGGKEDERLYYLRKRLQEATTTQVLTAEELGLLGMDLSGTGESWRETLGHYQPETGGVDLVGADGWTVYSDRRIKTPEGVEYASVEEMEAAKARYPMDEYEAAMAKPQLSQPQEQESPRFWWMSEEESQAVYEESAQRAQAQKEKPQPVNPYAGTPSAGYAGLYGTPEYQAPALPGQEQAPDVPQFILDIAERQVEPQVAALLKEYAPSVDFPEGGSMAGVEQLRGILAEDPDTFVEWAQDIGRSEETEMLMRQVFPEADEATLDMVFGAGRSKEFVELMVPMIQTVYPQLEESGIPEKINQLLESPGLFVEELKGTGVNPESYALMRFLYPEARGSELKDYLRGGKVDTRGFFGKFWGSFTAGTGDILTSIGGVLKWAGAQDLGEASTLVGESFQLQAPEDQGLWGDLVRTTPFFIALLPAAYLGFAAGGLAARGGGALVQKGAQAALAGRGAAAAGTALAALGRMGPYATYVMKASGAAAFSRPMESALEAGAAYEQALSMGMSPDSASEAAGQVFKRNLSLMGLDAAQFAAMFMPIPMFKAVGSLVTKGLIKTARVAGKMSVVGLTEAGEEYYQQIIQNQALGGDVAFWDLGKNLSEKEYRQVAVIGGIFGMTMGGFGDVVTTVRSATVQNLPPPQKMEYSKNVAEGLRAGMSREQAEVEALDVMAGTQEGQKVIQDVVDTLKVEWYRNQIKGKDAVDAAWWQEHLDTQRPVGIVGIPPGTVQEIQRIGRFTTPEEARQRPTQGAWDQEQRIAEKFKGLPYSDIDTVPTNKIAQDIREGVIETWDPKEGQYVEAEVTAEELDKFLRKLSTATQAEKHIPSIEAAIADRQGDLIETFRYESIEDGQGYEAYLDSLLGVTQKYRDKFGMPRTMGIGTVQAIGEVRAELGAAGQSKAAKLRNLADAMESQIEGKIHSGVSQQRPTAKRARQAEGMYEEGMRMRKVQAVLRRLADAYEAGTVPAALRGVSSKAQVEELLLRSKMPRPGTHQRRLQDLIEVTKGAFGAKAARELVSSAAARSGHEYWVDLSEAEMVATEKLLQIAAKKGHKDPWTKQDFADYKRLAAAGITTQEQFEAAKEEIDKLTGTAPVEEAREGQIRAMERELIGLKIPGFFVTPPAIAGKMADMADIQPGMDVLEPSAGSGRLAEAVQELGQDVNLEVIEYQDRLVKLLELKGFNVVGRDFMDSTKKYDRIIMNPPFEKGADIDHVRHAYESLKPGGRVVAIMSEGVFGRGDKKATAFREWLDDQESSSERLPEGSFGKEITATGVAARVVTIEKEGVSEVAAPAETESMFAPETVTATEAPVVVEQPVRADLPIEPEPTEAPILKMGDKVIYKGEEWDVGFVNALQFAGTLRLQKSGIAGAESVNYINPEDVTLVQPTAEIYGLPSETITEEAEQVDMFGKVTRVSPVSRGKVTQMNMEDLLKYRQYEESLAPVEPPVPAKVTGDTVTAVGPDPNKVYEFRYAVIELDDLVVSHTESLAVNPKYPKDLQPRQRGRLASKAQIKTMAGNLNADALLKDVGALDRGAMIAGSDNVIESGNGRVLALKEARVNVPLKFASYQKKLLTILPQYGIDPQKIKGMRSPILVRERLTSVDRVAFAAEANEASALAMSPLEHARQDAALIPDDALGQLVVGETQSIDQALLSRGNKLIVDAFLEIVSVNERAALVGPTGDLNMLGLARLKAALFAKTYPGDAGARLTQAFVESVDPVIRMVEHGMFSSLPAMARSEAMVRSGDRAKDLSLGDDIAKVVDMMARLKQQDMSVSNYLNQRAMFEVELTPVQQALLAHLDAVSRSSKNVGYLLTEYALQVEASPHPSQASLLGMEGQVTKEEILNGIIAGWQETVAATEAVAKELAQPLGGRAVGVPRVPKGKRPAGRPGVGPAVKPVKAVAPTPEALPEAKPVAPMTEAQIQKLAVAWEEVVSAPAAPIPEAQIAAMTEEQRQGLEKSWEEVTPVPRAERPALAILKPVRRTIMAWANFKGLPESQYRKLFMESAGHRQLHLMDLTELTKALAAVKKARPTMIKGKHVITAKTEKKIELLRTTLIKDKKLTQEVFERLVMDLRIPSISYHSMYRFSTEKQGKLLLRAMNDEAEWTQHVIEIEDGMAENPNIRTEYDRLRASAIPEDVQEVVVKIGRGRELLSMRNYMQRLETVTGAPLYQQWQAINMTHLAKRQYEQHLLSKLEDATGKQEFKDITGDEAALKRVEDFIASKHRAAGIKSPPDITAPEIAFAEEMERQLFQFRNDVRYARFKNAYAEHEGSMDLIASEIPDAPRQSLRRAVDLLEGKGDEACHDYLNTQEWGVIRSGYAPLAIVKPKIYLFKPKITVFGKGLIRTRQGNEFTQDDRTILDRYRGYMRQLYGLVHVQPLVRTFARTYENNAGNIENASHVAGIVSRDLNIMKGYREEGGFFHWGARKLYSQFAAATFWQPYMVIRNLHQNPAFNPDTILTLDPRNKRLSNDRRRWFEIFVAQDKGLIQDYLLRGVKPMPGFDWLTRMANRTSLFPWSDKTNRLWCFWLRINRADRALAGFAMDGDAAKLLKNSGAHDLTKIQQAEALGLLARKQVDYGIEGMDSVSGQEAFAMYVAQQHTSNVQFLYDRAQRAPAEQGPVGEIIGNILVFQRSWAERLIMQGGKLNPKATVPMAERIEASKAIIYIAVAGMLAGWSFAMMTGKKRNPYNLLNILEYSPGGLLVGSADQISETMHHILGAVQGDSYSMGVLPGLVSGVAKLGLPFYKITVQAIEASTDTVRVDSEAMRKVRALIDKNYKVQGGQYAVDRTWVEILQHGLFGAKTEGLTPQEKIANFEAQLGNPIEDEDLIWSTEDPGIYGLSQLSADIRKTLGDTPIEDVLTGDYSDLTKAWAEKEKSAAAIKGLPSSPIYKVETIYGDTKLSRRQIDLIDQYNEIAVEDQAQFLEDHPELTENPKEKWLTGHPEDNARLSLWGPTKLLTQESYDKLFGMMQELDIRDDLVTGVPPEKIAPAHFQRQELLQEHSAGSSEVLLFLLENPEYQQWAKLVKPENNIEVLRINVEYREQDDIYEGLPAGSQREAYLMEEPEYVEARIRRDAYQRGIPEEWIDTYVEYRQSGYLKGSLKGDRWLGTHMDFFNAVKEILEWEPLSTEWAGHGAGGDLPGMIYVDQGQGW